MKHSPNYRWFILTLTLLTFAVVISGPGAGLAVLFEEIAGEMHFSLVQIGWIWGIGSLLAIFTGSLCGALIDRFGPKRVLLAGIVLLGLCTALRGMATDFPSMMAVVLAAGGVAPMVMTSGFKISGMWFHRQLGLANGILSIGMAAGFMLGSLLAATVLSPALGGWRNVMFFFGILALASTVPWLLLDPVPAQAAAPGEFAAVPMRRALTHIAGLKDLWLLGLPFLGVGACQQGIAGYLAIYLRVIGWDGPAADSAVSLVYLASLLLILPAGFLSDRLGSRKAVLLAALAVMSAGTLLLSITEGGLVWPVVVLAGMMRDGSMALLLTMAVETEGVGPVYAGTATGTMTALFSLGSVLSPPIGNKLAEIAPGAPFVFWAGAAAMGMVGLLRIQETRKPEPRLEASTVR